MTIAPKLNSFSSDTLNLKQFANTSEGADAASGTSTAYSVGTGDVFSGSISSGTDSDWVRVSLVAGESYVFWVHGTGGTGAGINDTILALHNGAGTQLLSNDDISGVANLFSLIEYTATTTGDYFVNVGSYGSETGNYDLHVSSNIFTLDEIASYIGEFSWGVPTPIHFDAAAGDVITYNITGLTAAGQQLAQWALESWQATLGITFTANTPRTGTTRRLSAIFAVGTPNVRPNFCPEITRPLMR